MNTTSPYEIEKKFLIKSNEWKNLISSSLDIEQGYLKDENNKTIRIRIINKITAILTSKGKPTCDNNILIRTEQEEEIPIKLGLLLITQCDKTIIKTRHLVPHKNHIFEVDEFLNLNRKKTLIMAELELKTAQDKIELPSWIGKDITSDNSYSNSELIKLTLKNIKKDIQKNKP